MWMPQGSGLIQEKGARTSLPTRKRAGRFRGLQPCGAGAIRPQQSAARTSCALARLLSGLAAAGGGVQASALPSLRKSSTKSCSGPGSAAGSLAVPVQSGAPLLAIDC